MIQQILLVPTTFRTNATPDVREGTAGLVTSAAPLRLLSQPVRGCSERRTAASSATDRAGKRLFLRVFLPTKHPPPSGVFKTGERKQILSLCSNTHQDLCSLSSLHQPFFLRLISHLCLSVVFLFCFFINPHPLAFVEERHHPALPDMSTLLYPVAAE